MKILKKLVFEENGEVAAEPEGPAPSAKPVENPLKQQVIIRIQLENVHPPHSRQYSTYEGSNRQNMGLDYQYFYTLR